MLPWLVGRWQTEQGLSTSYKSSKKFYKTPSCEEYNLDYSWLKLPLKIETLGVS